MAGGPQRNTWQLLPSRARCCASWATEIRPFCKEQLAGSDCRLSDTDRRSAVREGGGDEAVETGDAVVVEAGLAVKWMHRFIGVEGWRGCSSCCSSAQLDSDFTAGHENPQQSSSWEVEKTNGHAAPKCRASGLMCLEHTHANCAPTFAGVLASKRQHLSL